MQFRYDDIELVMWPALIMGFASHQRQHVLEVAKISSSEATAN